MNPFDQAWMLLLKEMLPPNYTQIGNEEKDLNAAERAWQMQYAKPNPVTAPQVDVSKPPVVNLGENFFAPHSHERLTDRDRVVDKREQQEVRDRITSAMGNFLDEYGLFKPGAPKNIAIRTHLLDHHRQSPFDTADEESNGDSIVGIVRPKKNPKTGKRNTMIPELNTVMLRRSEAHHDAPQPFKAAALKVDKVVNAHGMSKKQMKRLAAMRRQNRAIRTGEPMDIAMQLLKERKSPEAMRRKLEYDKRYEKTPERRKYQRELHAERRKRGIYGSGDHMDVSHTQGGKLTLEPEHANRARHFKNRGTLRRVKVR